MRRSKAPSYLNKSSFKSPTTLPSETNPLCKIPVNTISGDTFDNTENLCDSVRYFVVVYGKRSTKKHKTWEGDGTLEVTSKLVTLKDEDNKVIGHINNSKSLEILEGSRIPIGGKEVEIIEALSTAPVIKKRLMEDTYSKEEIFQKSKKKRNSSALTPLNFSSSPITSVNKTKLHSHFEDLILPRPTDEHQWTFNSDCLPVTPVSVPAHLCRVLRPHQRDGIVFLYKCITGIRNINYNGAILADEMGLGKTLQCISLIWTLLNFGPYGGKPVLKKVLVVVPSSLSQNWNNEFIRWIGSHKIRPYVVDKKNRPGDFVHKHSPVLIISYEMFMRSYEEIKDIPFDLIVCDEGHRLKNCNIKTTLALNNMSCKRRILLTGTPIQNDLHEFYALVDLANHGILGSPQEFRRKYIDPIVASKEPNACKEILDEGIARSEELNRLTSTFILRRTQDVIGKFLPQKNEYVVFCEPTEIQKSVYSAATDYWLEKFESEFKSQDSEHLSVIHTMRKICNHPILVKSSDLNEIEGGLSSRIQSALSMYNLTSDLVSFSGKLKVVNDMLHTFSNTKERVVLVSNFTQTLDLFERVCSQRNYKYLRFDGATPASSRQSLVNQFNSAQSNIYVLLLSSKAGGVGLNLIGGSRLILYDSDWNPATDLQAMARIWREGQTKSVHIYRLLTSGTIEEKIFQRQLSKAGLSEAVVDPNSSSNVKLSKEELKDLFTYNINDKCLTHASLKCECEGNGDIPECSEPVEVREADLMPDNMSSLPSLRMNQLFLWEHHSKPVDSNVLKDMGIEETAENVYYVFKNKTQ